MSNPVHDCPPHEYRHGPLYRATFRPTALDTLRPEVRHLVGQVLDLRYSWTNEPDESYPCQPVFSGSRWQQEREPETWRWFPLEDLEGLREVRVEGAR